MGQILLYIKVIMFIFIFIFVLYAVARLCGHGFAKSWFEQKQKQEENGGQ